MLLHEGLLLLKELSILRRGSKLGGWVCVVSVGAVRIVDYGPQVVVRVISDVAVTGLVRVVIPSPIAVAWIWKL